MGKNVALLTTDQWIEAKLATRLCFAGSIKRTATRTGKSVEEIQTALLGGKPIAVRDSELGSRTYIVVEA